MARLFKGLRTEGPDKAYDAVIVGAGVGGLVLGNLLARASLKVLLIEQHYMVGGYCSTFRRAGYTFDAATHFYPLLGNPSTITGKLLVDLGVETQWVKMDPVDTFHFPDGSRFAVSADLDTYLARLKVEFPEESEALDRFFEEVQDAYTLGLLYYFRGVETERIEQYRHLTMTQVLDRHFRNRKLKLLLTADCPHWGSPPSSTSFVFDSMLRLSYFLGNYYPVGGSQAFVDELARRFEEQGGHILMSTHADKILIEDGAACGVRMETLRGPLKGKRTVHAGVVVSNADLLHTLDKLIEPQHLEPGYRESFDKLKTSYPCFLTHVGLRDVPDDLLHDVQGYYWNAWNPDYVGRNGLRCKIFSPTLYEPRMAPPGGQVVILQKVLDLDYDGVRSWPEHKAAVEDYIMSHLENVIPGLADKIVVKSSATAQTSHRFTLNLSGSMLGWEMSPEQLGRRRNHACHRLGHARRRCDHAGGPGRGPAYEVGTAPRPTPHDGRPALRRSQWNRSVETRACVVRP